MQMDSIKSCLLKYWKKLVLEKMKEKAYTSFTAKNWMKPSRANER